jgi:hypothetical protein
MNLRLPKYVSAPVETKSLQKTMVADGIHFEEEGRYTC